MFWEKILDFLKGYVTFFGEGGFPERFINLCSGNKIDIRNVKMQKDTITAECLPKSYVKIRRVAQKSGMKVRITGKHGLPFFLHRNRQRSGLLAGVVFMVAMTALLSGRIWVISVSGNENIPTEEIIEAFYDLGVKTGVKKEKLKVKEIAAEALSEIDDLMWNAVNVDGCKATIEIKEQVRKDIVSYEDETPSNIIASASGQVIRIENFIGTPVVETGSAVEKGDVIVSGAVINKDESVSFYRAEANVLARTKNKVISTVNCIQDMRAYGRCKQKNYISFFNVEFPVSLVIEPKSEYSFSCTEDFLSSEENKLPVGIIKEKYVPFENKKVKLTSSALKLMCAEDYFSEIAEGFEDVTVENMISEVKVNKNSVCILSTFDCVENIAESVPMDLKLEETE